MKRLIDIIKFLTALVVIAVGMAALIFGFFEGVAGIFEGVAGIIVAAPLVLADIETSDDAKHRRHKIFTRMQELIDKRRADKRQWSETEQKEYDQLKADHDALTEHVMKLEKSEGEALRRATRHISRQFGGGAFEDGASSPGWSTLDGRPVTVLSKEERLQDFVKENGMGRLSLGRAVRALVTGRWDGAAEERAALSTASGSNLLVPFSVFAGVLDAARAKSVAFRAGAQVAMMDTGKMAIAKVAQDPEIVEKAENAAFSNDNINFAAVPLTAKTMGAVCTLSQELASDSLNVVRAIEIALSEAVASRLDYLALNGSGSENQPEGLKVLAGVHEIDLEGDPLHYGHLLAAWKKIAAANGEPGTIALNPLEMGALSAAYQPNHGWIGAPELLAKMQWLTSTAVVHNSDTDKSDAFMGDFSQMVFGIAQDAHVEVSTHAGEAFQRHQALVKVTLRADIGVLRPEHFVRIVDIETPEAWSEINFEGSTEE